MGFSFNKSSDLNQKDIENVQSSGVPGPKLRTTLFEGTDIRISTIKPLKDHGPQGFEITGK